MSRSSLGTDGVRGSANAHRMTADVALALGLAAARMFRRGDERGRMAIGKDTRLSGYALESTLQVGFTSVGMDVVLLGPIQTPSMGMLTRSLRADEHGARPRFIEGVYNAKPFHSSLGDPNLSQFDDHNARPPVESAA